MSVTVKLRTLSPFQNLASAAGALSNLAELSLAALRSSLRVLPSALTASSSTRRCGPADTATYTSSVPGRSAMSSIVTSSAPTARWMAPSRSIMLNGFAASWAAFGSFSACTLDCTQSATNRVSAGPNAIRDTELISAACTLFVMASAAPTSRSFRITSLEHGSTLVARCIAWWTIGSFSIAGASRSYRSKISAAK